MIDAEQIRAARALLGWSQNDLVEKCGLSFTTIKRMESIGTGRSSTENVLAVKKALEEAGVTFIPENGGRCRRQAFQAEGLCRVIGRLDAHGLSQVLSYLFV